MLTKLLFSENKAGCMVLGGCLTSVSCLPITIFFAGALVYAITTAIHFYNNSVSTEALVESCKFFVHGGRTRNTSVSLDYSYEVVAVNGESYRLRAGDSIQNDYINCDDAPVGSTIQIQYLTDTPSKTQVTDSRITPPLSDALLPYLTMLVCTVFFLGVTVAVYLEIFQYFKTRKSLSKEDA